MESPDERLVVTITTDGATRGNPGPGGWAALLEYADRERLLDGEEPSQTTNNVMEMVAVAAALETLKRSCRVHLRCDSKYVLEGLKKILNGGSLPQKNREVWARLQRAAIRHDLDLIWVKGHAGDARNERVDDAANAAANRAYATVAAQRAQPTTADTWLLAICSAAAKRPVTWALHTPHGVRRGTVGPPGPNQALNMVLALVSGLKAAGQLPGAASAHLQVISNLELIIKQQRGEWGVKQREHQAPHAQAVQLRSALGQVDFEFQPTETVLGYMAL